MFKPIVILQSAKIINNQNIRILISTKINKIERKKKSQRRSETHPKIVSRSYGAAVK
jgi:hypothetical protein